MVGLLSSTEAKPPARATYILVGGVRNDRETVGRASFDVL